MPIFLSYDATPLSGAQGRPRPALMAFATCDVFGRFSMFGEMSVRRQTSKKKMGDTHGHSAHSCPGTARLCWLSLGYAGHSQWHLPKPPACFPARHLASRGTASGPVSDEESKGQLGRLQGTSVGP